MVRIQNETAGFRCNGDIHYARYSSLNQIKPEQGAEPWEKVRNFDFYTISSNGTQEFTCNNTELNQRNILYQKQCFCEIKPRTKPRFCAKEGQSCHSCNGQIIYGPRFNKTNNQTVGSKPVRLNIDQMINFNIWSVNTTQD
jgi:hypothetical protein